MSHCIYCDAPYVVAPRHKGYSATKLGRVRHLDYAMKKESAHLNAGRKPPAELTAHVDRLSVG